MRHISTKINIPTLCFYCFFFLYFFSYIGEETNIKYIAIVIFQLFLIFYPHKNKLNIPRNGLFYSICFVILSLFISLLNNFNIGGAIKTFSLIDLYILTFFMLSRKISNYGIDEKKMFAIITNSLFVTLLIAFITQYNDVVLSMGRSTSVSSRHQFGFGAVSIVGFLCFLEVVLSFYLLTKKQKNASSKIFLQIKILLSIYMIYLADIRSAMVSIVVFGILYIFNKLPKNRETMILKVLILVFSTSFFVFFLSYASLDMDTLNHVLSSRFVYYERAINEVISKNGIMFGLGSFRNSDVFSLSRVQVDNSYLDIFYQYGFFCLIPIIIMILKICNSLYKINREAHVSELGQTKYNNFINAYFGSVLIYSMVEKNLFSLSSALGLTTFLLIFWYIEKYKNH